MLSGSLVVKILGSTCFIRHIESIDVTCLQSSEFQEPKIEC